MTHRRGSPARATTAFDKVAFPSAARIGAAEAVGVTPLEVVFDRGFGGPGTAEPPAFELARKTFELIVLLQLRFR